MIIYKKTQMAIEFTITLTFVFVIIGLIMAVSGKYLVETNDKQNKIDIESFAKRIESEINIMNQVESGYYREIFLYTQEYNITSIHSSTLNITVLNNNESYYFDYKTIYNITLINTVKDGLPGQILVFEKEYINNTETIDLINVS